MLTLTVTEVFRHGRRQIRRNPHSQGVACIKGTPLMVSVVLDALAEGLSIYDICRQYPPLKLGTVWPLLPMEPS